MIRHHPQDEFILEYSNGSLAAAESLLVACHASMCPVCSRMISDCELISAAILDQDEVMEVSSDSLSAVLEKIDAVDAFGETEPVPAGPVFDMETLRKVPPPLRRLLDGSISELDWKRAGSGLKRVIFPDYSDARVSLIEIAAGANVPAHTHAGSEFTLVLSGTFRADETDYTPGDVAFADSSVTHRPEAVGMVPCLCLTVEDGPVRLTGPVGRLLNPFIKG